MWQKGKFLRVAEEIHTVYLLDKWAKMEARNLKRFTTAVGGLSALELTRLGAKPKEALPRRYDVAVGVFGVGVGVGVLCAAWEAWQQQNK